MSLSTTLCYAYSVLIFVGALIGFLRKGSVASLIGGSIFAVVFFAAAYIEQQEGNRAKGNTIALVGGILLLGLGIIRFLTVVKKMMPILFISFGAVMTVYQYSRIGGASRE